MKLPLLLILITLALSCGSKSNSISTYQITVKEYTAFEGAKQWDLFDDRPELYYSFVTDTDKIESEPSSSGKWQHLDVNDRFNIRTSDHKFSIFLYDDDLGSDNNENSSDSLISAITSELINDTDDIVVKQRITFSGHSGQFNLNNSLGNLVFEYLLISDSK